MFGLRRRQRDIFTFWDGQKERRIDPLPAWYKMSVDPECVPARDCKLADAGDRESVLKVLAMTRRMFDVKPLEQGGLTEYETSNLFAEFMAFISLQKKKRDHYRTQWALSVGGSQEESATPPESELSSTPNESSKDEPSDSSPQCPPQSET